MPIATISTKGQLVIPAEVRENAGLKPGDKVWIAYDKAAEKISLTRQATLAEFAERFTAWIDPSVPILDSASDYYAERKSKLV